MGGRSEGPNVQSEMHGLRSRHHLRDNRDPIPAPEGGGVASPLRQGGTHAGEDGGERDLCTRAGVHSAGVRVQLSGGSWKERTLGDQLF